MILAYLGISATGWLVLSGAVQGLALTIGVAFGLAQVRALRRQKTNDSLEILLREWRRSANDRDHVLLKFPFYSGTIDERIVALPRCVIATNGPEEAFSETLAAGRRVVHALNDLGGYLERGAVSEDDFFGHFHIRIVELVSLMEPYLLLVSACRRNRWGLRLRRLRTGAVRYHRRSVVHHTFDVQVRDMTVLTGSAELARRSLVDLVWRSRMMPTKEQSADDDTYAISRARGALIGAAIDLTHLSSHLQRLSLY